MNISLIVLSAVVFAASTLLFRFAAQCLSVTKLNIISIAYYLFMIQSFFGIVLISQGFDGHYTLDYLIDPVKSISTTFVAVHLVALAWPLSMLVFSKVFRIHKGDYDRFLGAETLGVNSNSVLALVALFSLIGIVLLTLLLYELGYVPLWAMLTSGDASWLAEERVRSSSVYVYNSYITNIGVHLMIPVLAYLSFAYALAGKDKRWIALALLMGFAAVLVKTYGFAKSTLVFHLLVYLLIYLYTKGSLRVRQVALFAVGAVSLIAFGYVFVGGVDLSSMDLYNSPFSRLVFTQVGTLIYSFDLFPETIDYLAGRSMAPTLLRLMGEDPEMHLRSARLLMEFYGAKHVYAGTAGVMNALFIGEAYSNYGWPGVALSVVWVGFVLMSAFSILVKCKKTPASIVLGAYLATYMGFGTQGGYFDFVYSFSWIATAIGLLAVSCLSVRVSENADPDMNRFE